MKQVTAAFLAVTMVATAATAADPSLKDTKDKLGYGIGLDMGKTFKKQGLDINPDALLKGFKDGFSGAQPKLSEEEIKATFALGAILGDGADFAAPGQGSKSRCHLQSAHRLVLWG